MRRCAIRSVLVASGPLVANPDSGQSFPRADVAQAIASLPEPSLPLAIASGIAVLAPLAARRRGMLGI